MPKNLYSKFLTENKGKDILKGTAAQKKQAYDNWKLSKKNIGFTDKGRSATASEMISAVEMNKVMKPKRKRGGRKPKTLTQTKQLQILEAESKCKEGIIKKEKQIEKEKQILKRKREACDKKIKMAEKALM